MDSIRSRVKVLSIKDSRIPGVKIIELGGDELSITMDLHRELITFREGEELEMVTSKNLPKYKDGVDLCARGVVVSIKDKDQKRIVISLWGYLVIIKPNDPSILDKLDLKPSDEIYYCLIK
ncbi:MAG: hypothetical protein DJ555_05015 [Desulfurococcaceae archaeon]|jgi:hypothetical protein|nr:MAG: hypothetical protein DJ555_05015 [Desulfurococcaceae archaeon]